VTLEYSKVNKNLITFIILQKLDNMKETFESSTKEEYERFKKTLEQTKKSSCFEDFMTTHAKLTEQNQQRIVITKM